jgi:hypothetical protein
MNRNRTTVVGFNSAGIGKRLKMQKLQEGDAAAAV